MESGSHFSSAIMVVVTGRHPSSPSSSAAFIGRNRLLLSFVLPFRRRLSTVLLAAFVMSVCLLILGDIFVTPAYFHHESQHRRIVVAQQQYANQQVAKKDPEESFSACLLIMDDNHWLSEWLAYHYFVLPLRHVILVRDPRSQTSPYEILERWKGRITFEEMTDEQFIPSRLRKRLNTTEAVKLGNSHNPLVLLHRYRQQFFVMSCLKRLKQLGKTWVLLTDSDEFIRPNPYIVHPAGPENNTEPRIDQPGSVLATIHRHEATLNDQNQHKPCLHVPRLQITSQDSSINTTEAVTMLDSRSLEMINTSHFLTSRWRYHSGQEIEGPKHQDGKNLVHVGRLADHSLPRKADTIHNVLPGICPFTTGGMLQHPDSWLLINHYLGTFEQYTYRDDPRDSISTRSKRHEAWHTAGKPASVHDTETPRWLKEFVTLVGREEAVRLLENVGVVEPRIMEIWI